MLKQLVQTEAAAVANRLAVAAAAKEAKDVAAATLKRKGAEAGLPPRADKENAMQDTDAG